MQIHRKIIFQSTKQQNKELAKHFSTKQVPSIVIIKIIGRTGFQLESRTGFEIWFGGAEVGHGAILSGMPRFPLSFKTC